MEEFQCFKSLILKKLGRRVLEMGVLKSGMGCRTLGMEATKGMYESIVVPTVLYGAET